MFKDIYSSPLLRAQETASAVSEERNIPLHIRPQLIERDFGNLEGHYYHHSKNDRKNFLSHQPKSAKSRNNIHHIESDQQIKERLIPLLKTIAIAHLGYKGQREVNDLFVTHSGIMRFLLRYFGHIRYEEMNGLIIHETAYIKVQFKNNRFSILDMDGVEGPPHLLNSLLNRPVVTS
jgi:broad specificity phosphatase PhoE